MARKQTILVVQVNSANSTETTIQILHESKHNFFVLMMIGSIPECPHDFTYSKNLSVEHQSVIFFLCHKVDI